MKQILTTLRILDRDGVVSISNLTMYSAIVYSLVFNINPYFLGCAVALYGFSRWVNLKRGQVVDAAMKTLLDNQFKMNQELKDQKTKLTSLSTKAGLYKNIANIEDTKLRRF